MAVRLDRRWLSRYDVVHGHFLVEKYAFLYPHATFITFLREPVARLLSAYYYLKHIASKNPHTTGNSPRISRIVDGRMDLVEFARDPFMTHIYRNYFGTFPLERFALIGITERYAESIGMLNTLFATDIVPTHERKSDYQRFEEEYRHLMPELREANEENTHIYEQAVALFEKRLRDGKGVSGP